MSPNIIGSAFILAETSISNADANNNNKTTVMQSSAGNGTCAVTNTVVSVAKVEAATPKANKTNESNSDKTVSHTKVMSVQQKPYKVEIVWHNVFLFIILHSSALYGLFLIFAENAYYDFLLCKYPSIHMYLQFMLSVTTSYAQYQSSYGIVYRIVKILLVCSINSLLYGVL